jgi:subtilisin-like proprotein convertase family protein
VNPVDRDSSNVFELLAVNLTGTNLTASYSVTFVLTIVGPATTAVYSSVLAKVTYQNTRQNPTLNPRRVAFAVSDGRRVSTPTEALVQLAAVNDAPVVDLNGALAGGISTSVTFIQGRGPVPLLPPQAQLFDPEGDLITSANLSLSPLLDAPHETLAVTRVEAPVGLAQARAVALNAPITAFCPPSLKCVSSTLTLPPTAAPVKDVEVHLRIDHGFLNDLIVELAHNGQTVTLVENIPDASNAFGLCDAQDLKSVLLSSTGPQGVQAVCRSGLEGVFRPAQALTAFQGAAAGGDWQLTVYDSNPSFVDGRLLEWGVLVSTGDRTAFSKRAETAFTAVATSAEVVLDLTDTRAAEDLDVLVFLSLDAGSLQDVALQLVTPSGQTIELFAPVGACPGTHAAFVFDDSAAASFAPVCSTGVATATLKPLGNLSAVLDQAVKGRWILRLLNSGAAGRIADFSLRFDLRTSVDGCVVG